MPSFGSTSSKYWHFLFSIVHKNNLVVFLCLAKGKWDDNDDGNIVIICFSSLSVPLLKGIREDKLCKVADCIEEVRQLLHPTVQPVQFLAIQLSMK